MDFKTIIYLIVIAILIGGLFLFGFGITGKTFDSYSRTYTKSVCNETNYCEDYEIVCDENKLVRMNPTGMAVQFSEDWEDSRSEEQIEKLC